MKIALAQILCVVGDPAQNLSRMEESLRSAASEGNDLVVFPELSDTGYCMSAVREQGADWEAGPIMSGLRAAAREARIGVIAGLSERVGPQLYNSAALIDADGKLAGAYRKIHLFGGQEDQEKGSFTEGNGPAVFSFRGLRIGIQICYDLRFPELSRAECLNGAELLVVVSAFPARRRGHWQALTLARAIENQVWVAACNRAGTDSGLEMAGCSRLIDPDGNVLVEAPPGAAASISGTIDLAVTRRVREAIPVFKDRREEAYRA